MKILILAVLLATVSGCDRRSSADNSLRGPSPNGTLSQAVYPDWRTSSYVLPYSPGKSYRVSQGNFFGGHLTLEGGAFKFAHDFAMPIGSTIVAARAGRVVYTRTHFHDGNGGGAVGSDNVVLIEHSDGTYALYGHLTFHGSLVAVGETVEQGQPIALSGNTGMTGGLPHLHFMVSRCPEGRIPCGPDLTSIPVTFRNTRANPKGLQTKEVYEAYSLN